MSLFFLSSLSIFMALVALSVAEPLYIGLILGLLAVSTCLVLGAGFSSLLGYFVFLIYVGGLMVLFGYILSVFPNQKFTAGVLPLKGLFSLFLFATMLSMYSVKVAPSFIGGFLEFGGGALIYLFGGVFLLFVLLLVASFCKKRHMPLRKSEIGTKSKFT